VRIEITIPPKERERGDFPITIHAYLSDLGGFAASSPEISVVSGRDPRGRRERSLRGRLVRQPRSLQGRPRRGGAAQIARVVR